MNEIRAIEAAQMEKLFCKKCSFHFIATQIPQENLDEKKCPKCSEALVESTLDEFKVGDTVKVHFKIIEGKTDRTQVYEGLVIAIRNSGIGKSFVVRKNSYGVGVERVFPIHSPRIVKVELVRPGKVRRAKLYYIRDKIGKAAKIKELIVKKSAKAAKESRT